MENVFQQHLNTHETLKAKQDFKLKCKDAGVILLEYISDNGSVFMTEFRQPIQVQIHLEMLGILVQLGHIQRTKKLAPQIDRKWSPTWILRRHQAICPLSESDGRYVCQISRAHRTHSRP